jgi:uncharacterized protein (TIGR00251 family)
VTASELASALRAQLAREGRLALNLRVHPKSPRSEWGGRLADGTLKVRLAAAPEKGKANEELRRFLAEELGVTRAQVEIVAGASGHNKQVRISGS